MRKGEVPKGYEVHHKTPIDAGGGNNPANLVLISKHPFHKGLTNYQIELTKHLKPGETLKLQWPVPIGFVYPPTAQAAASAASAAVKPSVPGRRNSDADNKNNKKLSQLLQLGRLFWPF
jgi:hypothetical protein